MQLPLLLTTLAASLIAAGPIPQPIPALDSDTVALLARSLESARSIDAEPLDNALFSRSLEEADSLDNTLMTRSLEARADQAQQLAQLHALALLRQNAQWGRGGGYPGRFSQRGGGFDLNVLGGLLDFSAGGGRTDYCTYPYC